MLNYNFLQISHSPAIFTYFASYQSIPVCMSISSATDKSAAWCISSERIVSIGLSQDLSISKKEAADYIERYFETYPNGAQVPYGLECSLNWDPHC